MQLVGPDRAGVKVCVFVYTPLKLPGPCKLREMGMHDKEGMRKREGTQRRERERAFRVKKSVRAGEKRERLG